MPTLNMPRVLFLRMFNYCKTHNVGWAYHKGPDGMWLIAKAKKQPDCRVYYTATDWGKKRLAETLARYGPDMTIRLPRVWLERAAANERCKAISLRIKPDHLHIDYLE